MIFLPFFWQKRVNEWKVAVEFVFPLTDGSSAPSRNIWSCLELCRVCLWVSVRGICFFSWVVVSSESSSVTGHWPVHISCQHESPTNQRLLVYKSPTQPDPNIFMSLLSFFFFPRRILSENLFRLAIVLPSTLVNTSESRSVSTTAHLLKG